MQFLAFDLLWLEGHSTVEVVRTRNAGNCWRALGRRGQLADAAVLMMGDADKENLVA